MTLAEFADQIAKLAAQADGGAMLTINGETVNTISFTLQNPLKDSPDRDGVRHLSHDRTRAVVFDISTNGREPAKLPVHHLT